MMMKTENCNIDSLGFYQQKRLKKWHRYADILVPLFALPSLIFIALYLNDYVNKEKSTREYMASRWKMVLLCGLLLTISLTVFVYVCIRLNTLGRQSRIHIPMIRSTKSNASFLRSINADMQYASPINNYPTTYDSITFNASPQWIPVEKSVIRV